MGKNKWRAPIKPMLKKHRKIFHILRKEQRSWTNFKGTRISEKMLLKHYKYELSKSSRLLPSHKENVANGTNIFETWTSLRATTTAQSVDQR